MGYIEIKTSKGWVDLGDLLNSRENCDKCGKDEAPAQPAGYQPCDPPELIIYFCTECRGTH
jgi:DNA-directed RNA polymerase subunit M/transcription elongation factor TFIIS